MKLFSSNRGELTIRSREVKGLVSICHFLGRWEGILRVLSSGLRRYLLGTATRIKESFDLSKKEGEKILDGFT